MKSPFKPGDKVKRIGRDFENISVGQIYTVRYCKNTIFGWVVGIDESEYSAVAYLFELISKREEHLPAWF